MAIKISNSTIIDDSRNIINASNLNVTGITTLGTVKVSSGIVTATSGIVTYYGDYYGTFRGSIDSGVTLNSANYANVAGIATYAIVAGIATYATTAGIATVSQGLTGTPNIVVGIVTATEYYGVFKGSIDSGVTLSSANYANVAGIATYAQIAGVATYSNFSGIATYATTAGIATVSQGLTGTPNIVVGIVTATEYYGVFKGSIDSGVTLSLANYANVAGIATFTSEWILGAVGSSDYTFTGPGFTGAESDPVLYLVRGQQYKFTNTMGAHPFRIQSTPNGSTGTQYNDGIINNDVSNGTLTWNVQFDTPGLLYYQCTAHGSMGGKIYIIDAGIGPDVSVNTTGTISAASIVGTSLSISGISTFTGIGTFGSDLYVGGNVNVVGVLTANRLFSGLYGEFVGGSISGTNIVGTSLSITGISTFTNGPVIIGSASSTGTASQPLQVTGGAYVSGNLGIGTTTPSSKLSIVGDVNITGVLTAQRLYSNIYGEFTGGGITGDAIVGTSLSISGISTLGTVRISSGIVTATSGVVTYYGDGQYLSGVVSPQSNGEFYTGITSSLHLRPLSYETTLFTFPATAGKQYVIESINAANVDTTVAAGSTVNIIASIQDTSGEQTYIAYNVPIVNGGLIELLKNAMVAGPSDVIKMWITDGNYLGVNNAVEVYMNYTEFTSTAYIREYASTVSIATTDVTAVYTSTTYPSVIESIHLANRTDTGDYPVSVTITNGVTTTFLAKDLVIPRYSTVDILDRPKRIELNGTLGIKVGQTSTIDVIIAGKQITS